VELSAREVRPVFVQVRSTPAAGTTTVELDATQFFGTTVTGMVLRRALTYRSQPQLPTAPPLEAAARTELVYLDVWQRHVTATEDPGIREVALGGPDTGTRLQTVCQVRWPPLPPAPPATPR
jgi:hypothetical protein